MELNSFGEINLKGCKQHSSGKLKFSSSQTNARFALASQPTLSYRVGLLLEEENLSNLFLYRTCVKYESFVYKETKFILGLHEENSLKRLRKKPLSNKFIAGLQFF